MSIALLREILGALLLTLVVGTVGWFRLQAAPPPDGTLRRVHIPILMYHYISVPPDDADKFRLDLSVTPDNFRAQMKWLKELGYSTITPDDLVAALTEGHKLPNRRVLLTFDDGYEDAYINALPVLKEFGFTGTFFIVTRFVDENRNGYLTWKQVKEMIHDGMSIQNHSRRHYDMRGRTRDWLLYEIVGPLQTIEAQTGVRPRYFCYPSGQYDLETIRTL